MKTSKPPLRAAWEFDLDSLPMEEAEHCCFYEHALESKSIRKLVRLWRRDRERFFEDGDEIGNLIVDNWFGQSSRGLVECSDFPRKHWLEIKPEVRKQIVEKSPFRSSPPLPSESLKYAGPQPGDFVRMEAEVAKWKTINGEIEKLRTQFSVACRVESSLRKLPEQLRSYFSEDEVAQWKQCLSELSGSELYLEANKLRLLLGKKIQRLYRSQHEPVPYEIDWTLRPEELKTRFGEWAEANRVHSSRDRGGGHITKPIERLKALGAMRLLAFFRKSEPQKAIIHAKALTERTANETRRPALYKTDKGWKEAEQSAKNYLNELFVRQRSEEVLDGEGLAHAVGSMHDSASAHGGQLFQMSGQVGEGRCSKRLFDMVAKGRLGGAPKGFASSGQIRQRDRAVHNRDRNKF